MNPSAGSIVSSIRIRWSSKGKPCAFQKRDNGIEINKKRIDTFFEKIKKIR